MFIPVQLGGLIPTFSAQLRTVLVDGKKRKVSNLIDTFVKVMNKITNLKT